MTNNVHAVGPAMAQLFRSFAAVPGAGDFAEQFVRSSSFFLLRMKGSELFSAYPLRAMCIFLDKVRFAEYVSGFCVLSVVGMCCLLCD